MPPAAAQELAQLTASRQSSGADITFRSQNGDVIALSGTTGGTIFYVREIVYPAVIYDLNWTYPASDKVQYDALVTHTAASFTSGPDHGGWVSTLRSSLVRYPGARRVVPAV